MMNSAQKEEAQAWLAGANQDDLIALYLDWKKVSSHFNAELKAVENDHVRITKLKATNAALLEALERHTKMFELVCDKVDFGNAFLDAETISEWNEASIQATEAIRKAKGE